MCLQNMVLGSERELTLYSIYIIKDDYLSITLQKFFQQGVV